MVYWWRDKPQERFWLEATDREDIGADLHAPELDESGKENWRYSLFKEAEVGDIVLHYDKRPSANGIIGWSQIAGAWSSTPVVWGARGTYARDKQVRPHQRPGFTIPLSDFALLSAPIQLDEIREQSGKLLSLVATLESRNNGKPLYFPFELSPKRPARLLQGYAFKLPAEFLNLFPALSAVERGSKRNPPWMRDELILALELYLRNPISPPSKTSPEVQNLSAVLNKLGQALGHRDYAKFRNANGVYMKMMNFRRFDPAYTVTGKVGLTRGNKDEEVVWEEFAADKGRLANVANAIRQAVYLPDVAQLDTDEEGIVEAAEGRLLTRLHRIRERKPELVAERKLRAMSKFGRLNCEACSFDFEERYGSRGKGFIEAHHTKPVETLVEGSKTKLEDLALLCANCHRMVHAARPWLSIEALQTLLKQQTRGTVTP
jgi:predicted HNH restriction endonuclease